MRSEQLTAAQLMNKEGAGNLEINSKGMQEAAVWTQIKQPAKLIVLVFCLMRFCTVKWFPKPHDPGTSVKD